MISFAKKLKGVLFPLRARDLEHFIEWMKEKKLKECAFHDGHMNRLSAMADDGSHMIYLPLSREGDKFKQMLDDMVRIKDAIPGFDFRVTDPEVMRKKVAAYQLAAKK